MSFRVSSATTTALNAPAASRCRRRPCPSRPATTCAAVTTSDGFDDPAASRDAQSACRAEHAHDARRGAANARRAQQRRIGRLDRRGGPHDRRERIDASEQSHACSPAARVVEPPQDERLLAPLTQRPSAPARAAPTRRRPRRARDPQTRRARDRRPSRASAAAAAVATPRSVRPADRPDRLEQERADRSASEPCERRIRRGRAAGEEMRREPRADDRPDDDAGQRQRARDQPFLEPQQSRDRDEGERDPVDRGHAPQA